MTIKELEERLDMTRANIRFYEQEGLLSPERGTNNYRIYSDNDVETLRKIKLLRQLGLSVDTIRKVQNGALGLDAALAIQQRALEQQRAELEWAGRVCAAMRDDKAEYTTLDAQKYLNTLDRPAEGEGYFSLKKDSAPMVAYPWRRFFARWLDFFLYGFLWSAFGMLVLRFDPPDNVIFTLLGSYLNYATMLVVEPLLLSTWGYTPGKWIFGLRVRDTCGGKIRWTAAMTRTWLLFVKGMGYGIPFYNLYRYYKSYRACTDCEVLPWEEECGYAIKDTKGLRCVGFVGAAALLFCLSVLAAAQAQMPRYQGRLTAEQYAANVNDLYHYITQRTDRTMDETGRWQEPVHEFRLTALGQDAPDHQLTLSEEGTVTAVTLAEDLTGETLISDSTFDKQLAALCFAAACGDYNCLSWLDSGVLKTISARPYENYTIQAGSITITQQVERRGYEELDGYLFCMEPDAGQPPYYRMEFTMALDQTV